MFSSEKRKHGMNAKPVLEYLGDQDIDRRPPAFYIILKEETVRIREGQVLTQDKEEFPVILNVQRWSALLGRR